MVCESSEDCRPDLSFTIRELFVSLVYFRPLGREILIEAAE
jgi:hypothetical protein